MELVSSRLLKLNFNVLFNYFIQNVVVSERQNYAESAGDGYPLQWASWIICCKVSINFGVLNLFASRNIYLRVFGSFYHFSNLCLNILVHFYIYYSYWRTFWFQALFVGVFWSPRYPLLGCWCCCKETSKCWSNGSCRISISGYC